MTALFDDDWLEDPSDYWHGLLDLHMHAGHAEPDPCQIPTNAIPGPGKVHWLRQRWRQRLSLWHERDAHPSNQKPSVCVPGATASTDLGKRLKAPTNGSKVKGDAMLVQFLLSEQEDEDQDEAVDEIDTPMTERLKRIDGILAAIRARRGA